MKFLNYTEALEKGAPNEYLEELRLRMQKAGVTQKDKPGSMISSTWLAWYNRVRNWRKHKDKPPMAEYQVALIELICLSKENTARIAELEKLLLKKLTNVRRSQSRQLNAK